ncbi:unnamed protein product [Linum tenue]|uniref:Uncharacterized protein n=1 Tax=Linum tenue TaxID=586396 RepID=A0AAV0LW97_9ROSI|nr:unnamed protein product [Linum tenue]
MQYYRRRGDSIFDNFTLNPLPYPVLLILAVIAIFLGGSWYFSYEELVESTESSMGLGLFVLPVLLIFLVRWLSSMESCDMVFFGMSSPWDRRRRTHYQAPAEGSSPWGVAALIVLLLVLLQFQSAFLDSWF